MWNQTESVRCVPCSPLHFFLTRKVDSSVRSSGRRPEYRGPFSIRMSCLTVSDGFPGFVEAHDGGLIISGGSRARRGRIDG
jgi:hypothetical protein